MVMPKPIEELSEAVQQVAKRAGQLRQRNAQTLAEIEAMGGSVNLIFAKLDHMLAYMVEMGVLTDEQMYSMNLDWEQTLHTQLKEVKSQLAAAIERARRAAMQQQNGLAVAKKRLIIPGQDGN